MTAAIVLASSLLAVLLAVALLREIRLRRALQKLLAKFLILWRTHANHRNHSSAPPHAADRSDPDRDRL
jgi:hypothetical protein